MGIRVVFLLDCHLVFSLPKHRGVEAFLNNKKMRNPNRGNPLNSCIDTTLKNHYVVGSMYSCCKLP